jgi:hypothetical protein
VTDRLEHTAQRIAERGRASLVDYLRPAFQRSAAAHAGRVELSPDQLEQMVQESADRADGLLWRRALAGVASDVLDISLGEALGHPAVARAQAIAGAPPYTAPVGRDVAAGLDPFTNRHGATSAEDEHRDAAAPELSDLVPDAIRMRAVHRGGIEGLGGDERALELRFSGAGLDILSADSDDVLGRLGWAEIQGLELPPAGGLRRRRRSTPALVVRTSRGRASFDVPGLTEAELRRHLAPMVARAGG